MHRARTEARALNDPDVVVLGGGPAGCAAATVLARRSHRVVLVTPPEPPASRLPESIPPSARPLLMELGLLEAVEAAGFQPNGGNTVWWAGRAERREDFSADEPGFHVERGRFERVLQNAAESVGVTLLRGSARSAADSESGWSVAWDGPSGDGAVSAPWLIDATGRHGLVARSEGRRPDRSTTTLALLGRWRRSGWTAAPAAHTWVESYGTGWAWSLPLDDEVRCFTAMIDQRETDLAGLDLDEMLDRELARTVHLAAALETAERADSTWACAASLYDAERFARPGLLVTGDAGTFIDPLSSYGVKKALSSGWLAAIAAHTALVDPVLADTAVRYFDAREREVYRRYRAVSADFFEAAADTYGTAYWTDRAAAARRAGGASSGGDPDAVEPALPEEAEVRAAFDEIRSRERLAAVPGPTLARVERPAVVGQRIVLEEHLATEAFPRGLLYVRGVDLRKLVHVAPLHPLVPDGWAAYNGVAPPVTLPDYLTALATAFASGVLVHRD